MTPALLSARRALSAIVITLAGLASCIASAGTAVLKNPATEVHLSTTTGKIMFFGKPGGPNLFWTPPPASLPIESAASAVLDAPRATQPTGTAGGSRIYPAQQALWHFIWGEEWSGRKFETLRWHLVEQTPNRVLLQSDPCQELALILCREFVIHTLSPAAPAASAAPATTLTVIDTATRTAPNPFPVQLWTVTQIPSPRRLVMTTNGTPHVVVGNHRYHRPTSIQTRSDSIEFALPDILPGLKIGTLGDTLVATFGHGVLKKQTSPIPGGCYPDGASIESYIDKDFIELETFGESRHLRPGETLSFTTTWRYDDTGRQGAP
ncbi:hypothetical protein Ga0100231_015740 [Opitutaceae bacterium TAV4]|nr:hypothetical protein Ga0100231_015740 [Opitutaceae bacterium TAV4]RRJ99837.1 hypothetical protein Ga0100230_017485 [Opitutaceae bacterium TAV3]